MATTGYKLVGGADIGDNLRVANTGYGPGTVHYRVNTVDMGDTYVRKATSYLTSADVDAFAGGQYFDGGSVELNSKFAHNQYRPIGAAGGGTSQVIAAGVGGTLNPANYGSSGLYNLILQAGGHDGLTANSSMAGGRAGGMVAVTGINISGLAFSVGGKAANTTVGAAAAYANGSYTNGGYTSAGGRVGGAGGAVQTSEPYSGYAGGAVAALSMTTDWTSTVLYSFPGGPGGVGGLGEYTWFPPQPTFNIPGFYAWIGGGGGGGASAFGDGGYGAWSGTPLPYCGGNGLGYGAGGGGASGMLFGVGRQGYGQPGVLIVQWNNV